MGHKNNYLQRKLNPHLKFSCYQKTVSVVCEEEKNKNPDITEIELTEKLVEAARKRVFDLERERGLKDCWPFLIFATALLWILAYSMFGLMDIPFFPKSNFPQSGKLIIGSISALVGYWTMLLARNNYYLIRQYKMEIIAASNSWQNLLNRYMELKIRETVERKSTNADGKENI